MSDNLNFLILTLDTWLADKMSDEEFIKMIRSHEELIASTYSRGIYLKLKNLDLRLGRQLLNKLKPCTKCDGILTIGQGFLLSDDINFKRIFPCTEKLFSPKCIGVPGPESYWQCISCCSITLFILPEREFRGWIGKVR